MLKVSENRRFLCHDDGRLFFYLGDTAWELFHRLNREEAHEYLTNRAAKGFTVIQAVALAELDGLNDPNAYGERPLVDNDPARPNEAYFHHVDWIVDRAADLGLYMGMLPTWGDKWNKRWGVGPEIFTPENARIYGRWMGRRYADRPIIWIVGGDRSIDNDVHRQITIAMAEGLREGDGGRHLISFHPCGQQSSAQYFHSEPWLDFNMWQSGHNRNQANYDMVAKTYSMAPAKPCFDGEPCYEDHPSGFADLDGGYMEAYDVRKAAYWALLAGACGNTYGCHPVWQMWRPGRKPITHCRRSWREAMDLPGAGQMRHAKALMLSRPYLSRVPDQSLIVGEPRSGSHHLRAARDADGTYAMVYFPTGQPAGIDLTRLSGERLVASWFDVRTGAWQRIGPVRRSAACEFTPPAGGPDWVLVVDDEERREEIRNPKPE